MLNNIGFTDMCFVKKILGLARELYFILNLVISLNGFEPNGNMIRFLFEKMTLAAVQKMCWRIFALQTKTSVNGLMLML